MTIAPLSAHSHFTARRPVPEPPMTPSAFPADAQAVIYKTAPSPMTSGRARAQRWTLRFERRSAPYIEPLMGWTGDDDTLSQIELSFPSAEGAITYARRQGLQYTVQGLPAHRSKPRLVSHNPEAEGRAARQQRRRRLEWIEPTVGPEVIRHGFGPGVDPAESYADPKHVQSVADAEARHPPSLGSRYVSDRKRAFEGIAGQAIPPGGGDRCAARLEEPQITARSGPSHRQEGKLTR